MSDELSAPVANTVTLLSPPLNPRIDTPNCLLVQDAGIGGVINFHGNDMSTNDLLGQIIDQNNGVAADVITIMNNTNTIITRLDEIILNQLTQIADYTAGNTILIASVDATTVAVAASSSAITAAVISTGAAIVVAENATGNSVNILNSVFSAAYVGITSTMGQYIYDADQQLISIVSIFAGFYNAYISPTSSMGQYIYGTSVATTALQTAYVGNSSSMGSHFNSIDVATTSVISPINSAALSLTALQGAYVGNFSSMGSHLAAIDTNDATTAVRTTSIATDIGVMRVDLNGVRTDVAVCRTASSAIQTAYVGTLSTMGNLLFTTANNTAAIATAFIGTASSMGQYVFGAYNFLGSVSTTVTTILARWTTYLTHIPNAGSALWR